MAKADTLPDYRLHYDANTDQITFYTKDGRSLGASLKNSESLSTEEVQERLRCGFSGTAWFCAHRLGFQETESTGFQEPELKNLFFSGAYRGLFRVFRNRPPALNVHFRVNQGTNLGFSGTIIGFSGTKRRVFRNVYYRVFKNRDFGLLGTSNRKKAPNHI